MPGSPEQTSQGFLSELKRRRVPRAMLVYGAAAFAVLEGADALFPALNLPGWTVTLVAGLLILGLPMVAALAWVFEWTPEGVRRTASSVSDDVGAGHHPWLSSRTVVLAALFLAVGLAGGWLARGGAAASDVDARSIAVLPFANLSGDPEAEPFTAGIHDDLLTHLFRIGDLKVISRTSVMEYRETTKNLREIAGELGVATIVEGGVQRAGNRLRVNAQLIDARTDTHLWAEQYDRELTAENVFAIQSEIARRVAEALHARLTRVAEASIERAPTASLAAYELYTRARDLVGSRYDRHVMESALASLQEAVALDSTFAEAWALLGKSHARFYWFHYDRTPARVEAARRAVQRALDLQPDLPEAHIALGYYHYWTQLDYTSAFRAAERAREGLPGSADVELLLAYIRRRQGRFEEAVEGLRRARELDPRSPEVAYNLTESLQLVRDYPAALAELDRALSLGQSPVDVAAVRSDIFLRGLGDVEAGRRELTAVPPGAAGEYQRDHYLVLAHLYARDWTSALEVLAASDEDAFHSQLYYVPRSLLAGEAHARRDDAPAARAAFDSARTHLEARLREDPTDSRFVSALALALSGLGRHEEAIREAIRATEMLPVEREAWRGSWRLEDLARVYAAAGEAERAIDILERLTSMPSEVGPGMLRLDPAWDPVRPHPRFQAMLRAL